MSLIREVFSGYAMRMRLENSLQLQKAQHIRPAVIKLEIATTINGINQELVNDAALKATFDSITLTVPA